MSMAFVAANASWIIPTAVGAGTALYGANKQSKDQSAANAANKAAIQESDLSAWKAYLMQRGLNPAGVTQFGQIPTNAQAVNTRLPLWATMSFPSKATTGATGASTSGYTVRRKTPRT